MTAEGAGIGAAPTRGKRHISSSDAETPVSHILTKLGCRDRVQLVALAYETGLVVPGHKKH